MSETLNSVVNSARKKSDKSIKLNNWSEFEDSIPTFRFSKEIYLGKVTAEAGDDISFFFGSKKKLKNHFSESQFLHFYFLRNIETEFDSHLCVIHSIDEDETVSNRSYIVGYIFFRVNFSFLLIKLPLSEYSSVIHHLQKRLI